MQHSNKIKRIIFGLLIAILLLPIIQHIAPFYKERKLNGSFTETENPIFRLSGWKSGEFQEQKGNWFNENFGFRPFFIRLYNQMYSNLHNQARANDVIIGKNDYLYEEKYIHAYLGTDYIGLADIRNKVTKLSMICDTLKSKGIDLIVVLAPGKASFYPEFIPDHYLKDKSDSTNYETIKYVLHQSNIPTLDFFGWFNRMKDTAAYPLFPKTGIHWSKYGEVIAADSLIRFIAQLRNQAMPKLVKDGIEVSTTMRDTDDDIEKALNLLSGISDLEMAYYKTHFERDEKVNYPRVSVIADSYYWGMHNMGVTEKAFSGGEFWYYFNEVYYTENNKPKTNVIEMTNLHKDLEKNDVIIYLSTEANLSKFGFSLVKLVYDEYYEKKK
jgi:hypothetical protein